MVDGLLGLTIIIFILERRKRALDSRTRGKGTPWERRKGARGKTYWTSWKRREGEGGAREKRAREEGGAHQRSEQEKTANVGPETLQGAFLVFAICLQSTITMLILFWAFVDRVSITSPSSERSQISCRTPDDVAMMHRGTMRLRAEDWKGACQQRLQKIRPHRRHCWENGRRWGGSDTYVLFPLSPIWSFAEFAFALIDWCT